jgi:hypothetical protein
MSLFSTSGKGIMYWMTIFTISLLLLGHGVAFAQRPTIDERLIRLEEGQKAINQRIGDVERGINKRIDDLKG